MNKYIAQLIMLLSIPTIMFGQVSAKYNAVTTDCAKITGNYSDFRWKWAGYDSQSNYFAIVDRGISNSITNSTISFKMVRLTETGNVTYVNWLAIATTNNIATFLIPYTNVPPNGDYMCEMWSTATNGISRTLSQGRITVFESLYRDNDATYPWASAGNMTAYTLTTTFDAHATNVGVNVHGLGSASTNNSTDFYLASNPSAFTNASVTNAHAQLNGVSAHGLGSASTNNSGDFYLASNPSGYISTYTETDPVWSAESNLYYKASNPSSYIAKAYTLYYLGNEVSIDGFERRLYGSLNGTNVMMEWGGSYIDVLSSLNMAGNDILFSSPSLSATRAIASRKLYEVSGVTNTLDWDAKWLTNGTWSVDGAATSGKQIVNYQTMTNHTSAYLPLAGGTLTGNINMAGNSITNLATIGFTTTGFTNYLEGIIQLNGTNYSYVSFYTNATSARTNLTALQ